MSGRWQSEAILAQEDEGTRPTHFTSNKPMSFDGSSKYGSVADWFCYLVLLFRKAYHSSSLPVVLYCRAQEGVIDR